MRSVSVALLALVAGCATAPRPAPRQVPAYDVETLLTTSSYSGTSVSPDGTRLLLTTDETGVLNAYAMSLATGDKMQLTHSTSDAIRGVAWLDDARFLFTSDQGGNELTHVYVGNTDGGQVDLTPGENLRASVLAVARDRQAFYVMSNERDPRAFDLYRYEAAAATTERSEGARPSRTLVFRNEGGFMLNAASRDLRYVVLAKTYSNANDDLLLWDAARPELAPRLLTPHEGDASHGMQGFSADGQTVFYTSDAGAEFRRLWRVDLTSGRQEVVAERRWDILGYRFTRDGRFAVLMTNADARTVVEVRDVESGDAVALPAIPGRTISRVETSDDGRYWIVYAGGSTSPDELYVGAVGSGRLERRTRALADGIDEADLVDAEVVRYPSFDGLEIPGLLLRPHVASPTEPVPALVWVHGGPGGQSRVGYRWDLQFLVNRGYAVLMVNNRGSSGYGKTFFHLDDQNHGEGDLQDCIYGRRYLETLDWVDGSRIGIIGGSYGGYMVAAALAFEPDAFDVGVNIFGVTNWIRTLENIPPWWGANRDRLYAELGNPTTDRERLRRISPLFHAANIRRPLMVVQGANDPRVLKIESDEIVAAAQANGVPVEYLVFDDEGHGFRNRKNRIASNRQILAFLDRYLRGSGVAAESGPLD
ncbi:MAG: alpha/beta fold hydrolase [Planctomycetota bacterium]